MLNQYQIDYPVRPPVVDVPCTFCGQPFRLEYDPGWPNTWEEPGMPADWYPCDVQNTRHPNCAITDEQWQAMKEAATNTPQYRAYEYAESLV